VVYHERGRVQTDGGGLDLGDALRW
jgi:hypothetical protein